jgi:hypothetical protein
MAMAPSSPSDPSLRLERLFGALMRHGVDFVVVGGIAGLAHGSAYPTFDLDVAYSRERPNLERLARALRELDVTLRGAPPDLPFQVDAQTLENGANFTFDSPYGKFDALGDVKGSGGFERLRSESLLRSIEGVEVRIASLDRLIEMKRAADRPKDRNMVEEYIVLADEIKRRESKADES